MASFLSTPLISAETALAADTNFLTWSGASDATDAKANYIFSDDSKIDGELPTKYAAISEMQDWQFTRNGMGAGRANFQFTGGFFHIVFTEEVGTEITAYTAVNRMAFKDQVAGFANSFIINFEATGQRLNSVGQMPFTDQFPFRGQATEGGKYLYQYGIVCEVGVY